ncbi:hypothetical protein F5Y08DRAFT_346196 [Xylaria arbuscula]|nr:hypothetical protein F5Y08DRAFT_346196 [Xylaria arbuscula]
MNAPQVEAFTSMADTLCELALDNPTWRIIELDTIVAAEFEGLFTRYPENPAELVDFNFWLNLQDKATSHLGIPLIEPRLKMKTGSPGRVVGFRIAQNQASRACIADSQTVKNTAGKSTADAAEREDESDGDTSDAISDTSFTPPKNLGKYARVDNEGRRHVMLQPQPEPQKQQRFVQRDTNGRRQILPPPGFNDCAPREIESEPAQLTFERKRVLKKPAVECGGISLAVKESRGETASRAATSKSTAVRKRIFKAGVGRRGISLALKKSPSETSICAAAATRAEKTKKKKKSHSAAKYQFADSRHHKSHKKQESSGKRPTTPAGWGSGLLKRIFEQEEDLLFAGRWPVSTF